MKLDEFLKKNRIFAPEFAERSNLSVPLIYNVLKGRDILLSNAYRISRATEGKVKLEDLVSIKEDKCNESHEKPNKQSKKQCNKAEILVLHNSPQS